MHQKCVTIGRRQARDAFYRRKVYEQASAILCACGCGESFRPRREWQKFKRAACRQRAYRARVENPLLAKVLP